MYRIGILDDEYLTCLGLKEAVPWESISVEVAFTCMDGKKGLELIKKEKPENTDLHIGDGECAFL